jgi:excisionase family DNA binding protein
MRRPDNDDEDEVQRLRRQLRAEINVAAKSFAEVLHIVSDLLIEIARRKVVPDREPAEGKPIPELLTTQQAANHLGLTPHTLAFWRCTRRYAIPFVKVGSKVRYRRADLDSFLRRRTENRSHEDESLTR